MQKNHLGSHDENYQDRRIWTHISLIPTSSHQSVVDYLWSDFLSVLNFPFVASRLFNDFNAPDSYKEGQYKGQERNH